MTKQTYVLLSLCGVSCLLAIVAWISGFQILVLPYWYHPAFAICLLLIAAVLIAFQRYYGVLICGLISFFMWGHVITSQPPIDKYSSSAIHWSILLCITLAAFLGMVWRDDFDDARIPKQSWRIPFWRSPD